MSRHHAQTVLVGVVAKADGEDDRARVGRRSSSADQLRPRTVVALVFLAVGHDDDGVDGLVSSSASRSFDGGVDGIDQRRAAAGLQRSIRVSMSRRLASSITRSGRKFLMPLPNSTSANPVTVA